MQIVRAFALICTPGVGVRGLTSAGIRSLPSIGICWPTICIEEFEDVALKGGRALKMDEKVGDRPKKMQKQIRTSGAKWTHYGVAYQLNSRHEWRCTHPIVIT